MKRIKSILSIILVILITFSFVVPTFTESSSSQTFYIKNVDDLKQFSSLASFDKWSKGKKVVLVSDIDLKGEKFNPIPIFRGIFEGNGYKISGINIESEGSNLGLFRYLEKGAEIRNLKVEGSITPKGDRSNIGGIVGYNSGRIENCSFSGYIKGKDIVGGIVGFNGVSGVVINAESHGIVYGENKVGGVVGYNTGTVLKSTNYSSVNTTIEENVLDIRNLTIENINISKLFYDVMDTGGIAGMSTGVIKDSINKGVIGYPSVGYNIGGIVGRQSGYISNCTNYGKVFGRKEIGGIVGQMEPYINTLITPSKLTQLKKEISKLESYITNTINNNKNSLGVLNQGITDIENHIDTSITHIESLIEQTEELINKDIEEINRISLMALEIISDIQPVIKSLDNVIKVMEEASDSMKKTISYLADAMGNMVDMFDEYQRLNNSMNYALKEMDLAINKFNSGKEKINKALEILKDSINELDIISMLEDIQKGTMDIHEFIENLGLDEVDLEELIELLEQIRSGVYTNIDYILKLIEILRNEEVLNLLKLAWEDVEEALEHIDNAVETIDDVNGRIENIIDSMRDTSSNMEKALNFMVEVMDILKKAEPDINFILEEINELIEYISSQAPLKFQTTNENYQRTKENLFDSIRKILSSFSSFKDKLNYQSNIMIEDIKLINSQMFKVINLILDIFEELNIDNVDIEDVIKDVSREDVEKTKEGKVSNCKNLGTIEGDINVGGIAGAMAVEIELDPEWDMDLKNRISVNAVYQTRAIIMESQNEGDVISKKNYVGGIVGKMDVGYITNAISSGLIKSKDGNYVGGIAGAASSFIDSSYAKCQLEGENYIGGIAGYGKYIKDSYTLVKVSKCKAYVGAIAGKVDENSNIERNYFVSDILNGIDGISYENKAEPIEYETLIGKENIPPLFKKFKLTFWADDKLVDSIEFNYGDSIPESLIPDVPQKEGYYGVWEEFNNEELKFDLTVKAVYSPYITAIESKEKRDDGLAIILVEGNFTEEDIIEIKELDKEYNDDENFIEKWNVKIPEDGNDIHIIRYYPKNIRDLDILVLQNGEWVPMEVEWDGKYIIFEVDGNSFNFAVIKNYNKWKYIFILVLIVLLVITIHIVRKRKIKN